MDLIEPTAERLREVLAQQRWLEAWRPTIDATPDWALLATGPAAVLLLLLCLRLLRRARSGPTHKLNPQAHARPSDPAVGSTAPRQLAHSSANGSDGRLAARRVASFHPKTQTASVAHLKSACFSPDGTRVLTTAQDDVWAHVWDTATGAERLSLGGHDSYACDGVFSPDGARIVTTSASGNVARVWDADTGRVVLTLQTPEAWVSAPRFSADSRKIVTVSCTWEGQEPEDNVARVWDAQNGKGLALLRGHTSTIESAVFSPDGNRIVTASRDKTARIWDTNRGNQIAILNHADWVKSASFSADGALVITAGGDARLWHAANGREILRASRGDFAEFSPDGAHFVVATPGGAEVHETASGRAIASLDLDRPSRENRCDLACFSPDGRHLILGCAGNESRASIWSTRDWHKVAEFGDGGEGSDLTASFDSSGTRILIAGHYSQHASVWGLTAMASAQAPLATQRAPVAAAARIPDEHGASSHFEKDGKRPDSILRCTIQHGDYDSTDFLDALVGAYQEDRFLRILMQNDEPDDPRGYWHSWDVPWSELVQVILRKRSTPTVHTDVRQPDGTYARKGPYLQTRLYKVGRGMECRLLDRDDPDSAAPFEWLKANIDDPEIRFAKDTQDEALYGDTTANVVGDSLDEYALRLKTRAERAEDEAFSEHALKLSDAKLADIRAAAPKEFNCKVPGQPRYELKDIPSILDGFDRWYATLVQEPPETIPAAQRDYAKTVIERMLLGMIKPRYCGLFFYHHFPRDIGATGAEKAKLLQVVRWMKPDGSFGVATPR